MTDYYGEEQPTEMGEVDDEEDEDEEEEDEDDDDDDDEEEEEHDETQAATTFNCTAQMTSTMISKTLLNNTAAKKPKISLSHKPKTPGAEKKADKSLKKKTVEKKSKSIGGTTGKTSLPTATSKSNDTLGKNKAKKLNQTAVGLLKKDVKKDKETMLALTKEQLVGKVHELTKELEKSKSDWIKFESDLRRELVTKWSKRVEDQEANHQEEIKKQRIQVEDHWSKKMGMLEELCEVKSQKKLEECRDEHQNETKKLNEKIEEIESELKKSYEQLELTKASLHKATEVNLFKMKTERMSQSAFETHLRLDDREEEDEEEDVDQSVANKTNNQDASVAASVSNGNKRKISNDEFDEEEEAAVGDEMEFEDDFPSCVGVDTSKASLANKSKRRHTLMNHSIQTDMFKGGNMSVQTDAIQRRSVGLEVVILCYGSLFIMVFFESFYFSK